MKRQQEILEQDVPDTGRRNLMKMTGVGIATMAIGTI